MAAISTCSGIYYRLDSIGFIARPVVMNLGLVITGTVTVRIMRGKFMNNAPIATARLDYKGGVGQEANPYPKGTQERVDYTWEMHRLQRIELLHELGAVCQQK